MYCRNQVDNVTPVYTQKQLQISQKKFNYNFLAQLTILLKQLLTNSLIKFIQLKFSYSLINFLQLVAHHWRVHALLASVARGNCPDIQVTHTHADIFLRCKLVRFNTVLNFFEVDQATTQVPRIFKNINVLATDLILNALHTKTSVVDLEESPHLQGFLRINLQGLVLDTLSLGPQVLVLGPQVLKNC